MTTLPEIGHNQHINLGGPPGEAEGKERSLCFHINPVFIPAPSTLTLHFLINMSTPYTVQDLFLCGDAIGISSLRCGSFFPEIKGSPVGLNALLWVSQGHGKAAAHDEPA